MASFIILVLAPMLVLGVIPNVANAQTNSKLTLGSDITAGDPTTHLLSPSGEFAFGFQAIGPGFLLAIWFEKIPNNTIVWSANGDKLVPRASKLRLNGEKGLFLEDPQGREIWSVNQSGSGFAYALMLDTGNLVLMKVLDNISWDTFSNPTDTILPTQILGQGSQLVARYSQTNYSDGRFTLVMQDDGNLVLYSLSYPLNSLNTAYWAANTVGSGFELVFNQTGQVYLNTRNGTVLTEIQSSTISTDEYYQRAVLDPDGVFWQYVYPKSLTSDTGWLNASNPVPSDICMRLTQDVGSGACGFNSYCTLGSDQRPSCKCPSGYVWLNPDDETQGCKQDFSPQNCDEKNPEGDQFILVEMNNTDWPPASRRTRTRQYQARADVSVEGPVIRSMPTLPEVPSPSVRELSTFPQEGSSVTPYGTVNTESSENISSDSLSIISGDIESVQTPELPVIGSPEEELPRTPVIEASLESTNLESMLTLQPLSVQGSDTGSFETPGALLLSSSFEVGESSSRVSRQYVYSVDVDTMTRVLLNLLHEDPMTQEGFSQMKMIVSKLQGLTIPQALGSACVIFDLDFWHDWEEYSAACAYRAALKEYFRGLEETPVSETVTKKAILNAESEVLQEKLSSIDAEIARLQAEREFVNRALEVNQNNTAELELRLDEERGQEEERGRQFTVQRISHTRFSIKESVRAHLITELSDAMLTLERCGK